MGVVTTADIAQLLGPNPPTTEGLAAILERWNPDLAAAFAPPAPQTEQEQPPEGERAIANAARAARAVAVHVCYTPSSGGRSGRSTAPLLRAGESA